MSIDFRVFAKGMLMGAADIVPGVSGGTIAFITGIYEHLIFSLRAILPAFLLLIKNRNIVLFWQQVNGTFLLTLFSGILLSVALFARLISYLLVTHPIPVWSCFFGLIVASVFIVARQVSGWNVRLVLILIAGALLAYLITVTSPTQLEATELNVFISGVLAICAMVLPGISGSFILVILGTYAFILEALKGFDIGVLVLFASGCVVGLLSISNILAWAFSRFRLEVLALLTGFMIGALNKVWPWKEVLSYRLNSHGQSTPLLEAMVSPSYYETITGMPSQQLLAFACMVVAAAGVIFIERVIGPSEKQST